MGGMKTDAERIAELEECVDELRKHLMSAEGSKEAALVASAMAKVHSELSAIQTLGLKRPDQGGLSDEDLELKSVQWLVSRGWNVIRAGN
jgi:hypothetical protein